MKQIFFTNWKIVLVNTKELAETYKREYEAQGNVGIEIDYILGCVTLLIYKNERLIGGVVINSGEKQKLRYLEILKSKHDRDILLKNEEINENDLMELTAIYHTKGITPRERLIFYGIVFYQTFKYLELWNKIGILGASVIEKIQKMQMRLMPHLLLKSAINESFTLFGKVDGVVMIYYCTNEEFAFKAIQVLVEDTLSGLFKIRKKVSKHEQI
jgi:hypothetical protein